MRALPFAAVLLVACGSDRTPTTPSTPTTSAASPTPAPPPAMPEPVPAAATAAPAPLEGHDFTSLGRALFVIGACGEGAAPDVDNVPEKVRARHCAVVNRAQAEYAKRWVARARTFFAAVVPKDAPKKVVYPFAGGDLSTALTVYPDADEITTLSLEPAGDPRTLRTLKGRELASALGKIEYELKWLYRVNFSNTMNMIDAMRGGMLPTQLIFGLSALKLHGYELVSLRYFRLEPDGSLHYLDDTDLANVPAPDRASAAQRNLVFANAEVRFRKGDGPIQVWRHIRANLGNETGKGIGTGLEADPRVLRHLEAKGQVAAMTKAASYLLSWDTFSLMRNYLLSHTVWMVSDATGVAPKWGKAAGFEYETYGAFEAPHIAAGNSIAPNWKQEFAAQPKRPLAFRFGYYDKRLRNHLVIMRKKA